MSKKSEIMWLCEHAKSLEKFSGQWVIFNCHEGLVSNGETLEKALSARKRLKTGHQPFVFHVPTKRELWLTHSFRSRN